MDAREFVMRGLDPRIHLLHEKVLGRSMDCRVRPGNDDLNLELSAYGDEPAHDSDRKCATVGSLR